MVSDDVCRRWKVVDLRHRLAVGGDVTVWCGLVRTKFCVVMERSCMCDAAQFQWPETADTLVRHS